MSRKLRRHSLPALFAFGALLLLGCTASERSGMPDADYGALQAGGEPDAEASRATRAQPARRVRASLSMPYFSFAQSLNPRS